MSRVKHSTPPSWRWPQQKQLTCRHGSPFRMELPQLCLQSMADCIFPPPAHACRLHHANITVDVQAELARSEERRTALEEIARQGLIATNSSEYGESAEAQRWRSMQRETMWLRAKICVLAHFCKVLRQRLDAAEQRHVDIAYAAVAN